MHSCNFENNWAGENMFVPVRVSREVFGNGEDLLVCGNSLGVLEEKKALYGKAQCVYTDPPFMTGERFTRKRPFGRNGWAKGSPNPAYPAFEDRFADEKEYIRFLKKVVAEAHALLSDTGVFCLHIDWRMDAQARILCDKVFGRDMFLNEIIWAYESGGRSKRTFSRKHDVILLYAKTGKYTFDLTKVPLSRGGVRKNHMKRAMDEDGRMYSSIVSGGKEYRYYDDEPTYPGDVWTDISHLQQRDPERTGYATQKPMKLLERLLKPVTKPGDWVVDLCCGSGTTLETAQRLGCHFAGFDLSPEAIAISLARVKNENLTVICPCDKGAAKLLGNYDPEGKRLTLEDLETDHPAFPVNAKPGDRLESWELGHMEGKNFVAEQSFRRSFRYPDLTMSIRVEDMSGKVIMTTDAAGKRKAWRLGKVSCSP